MVEYVIVGAEVSAANPFNVETIGRLMVELSKLTAQQRADLPVEERNRYCDQIKKALTVESLSEGEDPSDEDKKAILENTTVLIQFESRTNSGGPYDLNTRVLVVPSDNTLAIAERKLREDQGLDESSRPPLTYDLDERMMLVHLKDRILKMIEGFSPGDPGWTDALNNALKAHVAAEIDHHVSAHEASGHPFDSVETAVMRSPVRAFHRSVGIYATNMCR